MGPKMLNQKLLLSKTQDKYNKDKSFLGNVTRTKIILFKRSQENYLERNKCTEARFEGKRIEND